MNPIIGRGIALLGALLLLISPFPDLTDGGPSLWDSSDVVDIMVLLAALAAGAMIALDLATAARPFLLLVAAGLGLFALGIFLPVLLESDASALGTYLGTLGAVLIVAGSLLSYLVPAPAPGAVPAPALAQAVAAATPAAAATPSPPAAAPAAQQPQQQQQQQPAAGAPAAGWYSDPSGTARLRYWDGQAWTEHTSA